MAKPISIQAEGTPWTGFDPQHDTIAGAIAEEATGRVMSPVWRLQSQLLDEIRTAGQGIENPRAKEHLESCLAAFDALLVPVNRLVAQLSASIGANIGRSDGTLEDLLQQSMAASGIESPDDAERFVRTAIEPYRPRLVQTVPTVIQNGFPSIFGEI